MDTGILTPKKLFQKDILYTIPEFQRQYVWTQEEQWEPLWNDVRNTAEGIDKLTVKSPFWLRFVFAHKIQPVDYHSYLFFNRVRKIKKSLIF